MSSLGWTPRRWAFIGPSAGLSFLVGIKTGRMMPEKKAKGPTKTGEAASQIRDAGSWHEQAPGAAIRALIMEADPEMTEERKWKKPSNGMVGVPVWSHNGIVCTGETYKAVVKLTFAKGAGLPNPSHLFNSSLEGNTRRAIDIPRVPVGPRSRRSGRGEPKALVPAFRAARGGRGDGTPRRHVQADLPVDRWATG